MKRRHWWAVTLAVVVLLAMVFGSYAAIRLQKGQATCEQLNVVIKQQNIRGDVIRRFLTNAADAREARALLESTPPSERRIEQRAAYLFRLDAELVEDTKRLKC